MTADARPDFGFVRVAAAVPPLRVADVDFNLQQILDFARKAEAEGAQVVVFPELSLTSYTAGDLFHQHLLLDRAADALLALADASSAIRPLLVVGVPARGRGQPVQHRGGRRPGRHSRPGAEDLHPGLQGVLRRAVVRLGSRPGGDRSESRRPGRPRRQRPALPRPGDRRPRHRRRDLRRPLGPAPAEFVPGAPRRASDRQPVGLQRAGREGRLPAIAGRAAVGPGDLRLRLRVVRRRRIEPGRGLRRPRRWWPRTA